MNKNIETFIGCNSEYNDAKIVMFGAPFDSTTSFRPGARFGSSAIRHESFGIETYSPYQDKDLEDTNIFDCGDLELCFGSAEKALEDILNFHVKFECIHPFQDGNGRVGRLIMFKECLKYNIVPFIIEDNLKMFYYRGLKEWNNEKGYLMDTCLTAQDRYKAYLDYFRIAY